MKKIMLAVLAALLVSAVALAQFPGETFKQVTGTVKSVTPADAAKGSGMQVTVADDKSAEMTLSVDPTSSVFDAEYYPITLDQVKAGCRVNIRYNEEKDGGKLATWFNILK